MTGLGNSPRSNISQAMILITDYTALPSITFMLRKEHRGRSHFAELRHKPINHHFASDISKWIKYIRKCSLFWQNMWRHMASSDRHVLNMTHSSTRLYVCKINIGSNHIHNTCLFSSTAFCSWHIRKYIKYTAFELFLPTTPKSRLTVTYFVHVSSCEMLYCYPLHH